MRLLRANEIEIRIGTIKKHGASLLLYKNARVDMQILDEEFGAMNWKREHTIVNNTNYCTVSAYNKEIGEWISKQDCGVETFTEKQKGESSDAFKRACVNWGIGRELYTAPFIWVSSKMIDIEPYKDKLRTNDKFTVKEIHYNEQREIKALKIINQENEVVFNFGNNNKKLTQKQVNKMLAIGKESGYVEADIKLIIKKKYGIEHKNELSKVQYDEMCEGLENNPKK